MVTSEAKKTAKAGKKTAKSTIIALQKKSLKSIASLVDFAERKKGELIGDEAEDFGSYLGELYQVQTQLCDKISRMGTMTYKEASDIFFTEKRRLKNKKSY